MHISKVYSSGGVRKKTTTNQQKNTNIIPESVQSSPLIRGGGSTFQGIVDHFPWVVNEAFQWKRSCRPYVGWQLSRLIRKIVPVFFVI